MKTGKLMIAVVALLSLALQACEDRAAQSPKHQDIASEKTTSETQKGESQAQAASSATNEEVQDSDTLWVIQARGSKQCEGGGLLVEQSRGKLQQSGVAVVESRCGVRTDRMYPAVCGGATGDIYLHRIKKNMLDAALELGFDPLGKVPYEFSSCKGKSGGPSAS